jgi:hypothetical protein
MARISAARSSDQVARDDLGLSCGSYWTQAQACLLSCVMPRLSRITRSCREIDAEMLAQLDHVRATLFRVVR